MSSVDHVLLKRCNAARCAGPKTDAGKIRASKNALKHGLNVSIRNEPGASDQIEALAVAIAGDNPSFQQVEAARSIAEAYFELRRVKQFKLAVIESEAIKLSTASNQAGDIAYDYASAFAKVFPLLTKADRYELRAMSRRHRAVLAYLIAAGG